MTPSKRPSELVIIGLTGSIGMGKSAVAARFRAKGVAVFDADAAVHALYAGAAVPAIEAAFPGSTRDGAVDRAKLTAALMQDVNGFKRLEAIVHPLVQAAERAFLQAEFARGARLAVLEVPLLFETQGEARVDVTVVASAPAEVQLRRVLQRPGMTRAKLDAILQRQLSNADKRGRADFVVDTGGAMEHTFAQVDKIIASLERREGAAYRRFWV